MHDVSLGKKRLMWIASLVSTTLIIALTIPFSVTALTLEPVQVLPPAQGKSCSPVSFSEIQPHIYSGNLDSFDLTISDANYVAIETSVDGIVIPYHYLTRWHDANGGVRLHVDLSSIRMDHDVPIQIAFMAASTDAAGRNITCVVNFQNTFPTAANVHDQHRAPIYIPVVEQGAHGADSVATSTKTADGSIFSGKNIGLVAVSNSLGKLCARGGSSKLWALLLVLYAIFVITLLAQKIEQGDLGKEWNIALILALFLGLLIFWYVSAVCRTGPWAPALATFICVAGLIFCIIEKETPRSPLLLKDGRK